MEQQPHEPTDERKKQRDAEPTVTPKSWSEDEMERGNREDLESHQVLCRKSRDLNQSSLTIESDEARLEQKRTVDKTESLYSSKSVVHQFNPSISAQSGGNVVNPLINGCRISNFNINITSSHQGSVNHDASSQPKYERISECQQKLRDTLKKKFSYLLEGMPGMKRTLLKNIYTELHIIKGGCGEVIKEHEVRRIETEPRTDETEEEPIHCSQLFIPPREQDPHIRTVITRGVAGIGKTVSTNKFALDWAEERENTNLDLVFPIPFKDLNLISKEPRSLVELLDDLFPDLKDSKIFTLGEHKMLFILDGLDESRLSLDFSSEIVRDVTKKTTVNVLLINIIRGELLPSALVWITSRPEAFDQIPQEFVDLVIEVRGFSNSQKDEYFRKKIGDLGQADRVISHVKSCRSLHIMCHLPVFCWMAASVLQKSTPPTLTPMYIHFLTLYVESMKRKLPGARSTHQCVKTDIISLGKLAFEELDKDLSIFYESDLTQYGIQVTEPSMLSGIYTQIFSEELLLCQEKMFSFVHLSVQEFFAALYVYLTFNNDNVNVLTKESVSAESDDKPEFNLYKAAVEKALQCENGHFDIFLRFLLGLSLESNQKLLKYLIGKRTKQKTRAEIIEHIKEKIRVSPSSNRRCNLLLCLKELGYHSMEEKL